MRFKLLSVCTLAAVTSLYGLSAQATTMTIDFDSGTLAGGVYTQGIFQVTPVNIQNSTQCATGACTQEAVGQGLITTLTRTDGLAFDLDGFYFALEGNGQGALNDVTITDTSPGGSTSFNYKMGDKDTNGHLSFYLGAKLNPLVDVIDKSTGANGPFYVANYSTEFDGVTSITWYGGSTAKTRIDDLVVTYNDNNQNPPPVPLPAGGLLLLTGLAGIGAVTRWRKQK